MSRRRPAPAPPPPAPRRGRVRLAIGAAVVLVLAGAAWALLARRHAAPAHAGGTLPLDSVAVVDDALQDATRRGDWPAALLLSERLAAALPRHPVALRRLATALHNAGNVQVTGAGRSRTVYRNSLERTAATLRAVALMDSSGRVAADLPDRVAARYWAARIVAGEGLPLDALALLEDAARQAPGDPTIRAGLDTLRTRLASPLARPPGASGR